jgi:cation transport ATPase
MLTLAALLFLASGVWMLFAAPSLGLPGGDLVGWLAAAGLLFAGAACVSLLMLLGRSLVDWSGARARRTFKLITPHDSRRLIA